MCGIAAVVGTTLGAPEAANLLQRILARIAHRGEARFQNELWQGGGSAAGANRLALTSADETQPTTDETGRYKVFLNGEIYSLHGRRSDRGRPISDTRALAEEIGRKGVINAFHENHGMYAAVVFDTFENCCFLTRDPFGIKPLYFASTCAGVLVASEIKALSQLPVVDIIHHVEPGETIRLSGGPIERTSAPRLQGFKEYSSLEQRAYADCLRYALETSVREQTRDGHTYGLYLSGGVDSGAIFALACRIGVEIVPFVLGHPHSPDVEAAQLLTRHFDRDLHVVPCPSEDELFGQIENTIRVSESFEPNVVRQAGLSIAMANYVKGFGIRAILCGEGSDELFGGYPEFWGGERPFAMVRDRFLADLPRTQLQRVDRANMASTLEVRVPFLSPSVAALALSRRDGSDFSMDVYGRAAKLPLRQAMQDLLPKEIAWREKVVFSEGAGLGGNDPETGMFAKQIEESDWQPDLRSDDLQEWQLASKEEEFFFSTFRSFGFDKYTDARKRVFANRESTIHK